MSPIYNLHKTIRSFWLFCMMMACFPLNGYADIELKHLTERVPVEIVTPVDTLSTPVGQAFEMILPETLIYQDQRIPANTQLRGTVKAIRSSRRMGRPARFEVAFEKLTLPNQAEIEFTNGGELVKMGHRANKSSGRILARQALIAGISAAITIPLAITTDIDWWALYLIDQGVDATVGATQEVFIKDPYDERSTGQKIGTGVLRGITPFPAVFGLARKAPEVQYDAHQVVALYFPKTFWTHLFQAADHKIRF